MKYRVPMPTLRPSRILLLVAILAALTPLPLHIVSVSNAQSETVSPVPGGGGDPGGPAAPVLMGTSHSNPNYVRFTWERVEGEERYEVLWRRGNGGDPRGVFCASLCGSNQL